MGAKSFEDLKVWQKGRALCKHLHPILWGGRFQHDYSFRNQIWSAANSIPANIAEGFERMGNREFINFLSYAKGSAAELKSHCIIAHDNGYLNDMEFDFVNKECQALKSMIGAFMEYLIKSDQKGSKFAVAGVAKENSIPYSTDLLALSNEDLDSLNHDFELLIANYIKPYQKREHFSESDSMNFEH